MTIGEWIHSYRTEHELSMADFAKRTGLSKASIGFLEKGSSNPTTKTLTKIASAVGISVQELLERIDSDAVITIPKEPHITLAPDEEELVTKYRQLSPDGKNTIRDMVDYQLFKEIAQKDAENVGIA